MIIASLPMYDFEDVHWATNALWAAIASRLGVRGTLERSRDVWLDPNLLLAQTCGYPLVTQLAGKVQLVATPRYTAKGCEGALYRSAVVVRADDAAAELADLRGRRCAVNGWGSNSGMNVLRAKIAPLAQGGRFFGSVLVTGAHQASAAAVAKGEADVAAIDCVTWAHLQRLRPYETRAIRVLAWTAPSPGLPLITSAATDTGMIEALLRALEEVACDPGLAEVREALFLDGFERIGLQAYNSIMNMEQNARHRGYPVLR